MSRARQTFRQCDLVKALKALAKAGMSGRVEITDSKITIIASAPEPEQNSEIEETSADLRRLL